MPRPLASVEFVAGPGVWRVWSAAPDPVLKDVVREYWEVAGLTTAFQEHILPHGYIELMFNLGSPQRLLGTDADRALERAWVSGLQDRPLWVESGGRTHLASIRLHPVGAWRVLGLPLSEIGSTAVDLDAVLERLAAPLYRRLVEAGSPEQRFAEMEAFVAGRVGSGPMPPATVSWAAARIAVSHGRTRIGALEREAGVSRRYLNALFRQYVGQSPKTYARISRFAWTVGQIQGRTSVDWCGLALEAGYADQAHLSREFARLAGASPTAFLRRRAPDGTSLLDW